MNQAEVDSLLQRPPKPTYDDLRPSATASEAVDRLVEAHKQYTQELTAQRDALLRQRDELRQCLHDVRYGFTSGQFVASLNMSGNGVADFARFLARLDAALLRSEP